MNQKRNSKTLIKLPKIISSPVKSPERNLRRSVKAEDSANKLTAVAFAIYSMDLQPIVQFNKSMRREIASLTKMMTMLCTVKLCEKYKINMTKCYFRVTTNAAGTRGTTAELESREWVTIQDLLHGLMLPSGNDAALVLAENLGACVYYDRLGEAHLLVGNSLVIKVDLKSLDLTEDTWNIKIYMEQFVKIMNNVSKEIGMKQTCYVNPHGLDCSFRLEAYSTAQDQAILIKALIENNECSKIIGKTNHTGELKTIASKEVQIRKVVWQNTNILLGEQGFIGGKTGQTQNAGNCLASIYQSKNKTRFIIVLLGCASKELRFSQTRALVDKYIGLKQN